MIHVAIDITALARNRFGGIARVCAATAQELSRHSGFSVTAYWSKGDRPDLAPPVCLKRTGIMPRLLSPSVDITHSLCHRMLRIRSRYHLYSVHDAWSLHPNRYQSDEFQRKLGNRLRRDMEKADVIVTGSEWSKSELIRLGAVEGDRCHVIPDGVDIPQDSSASDILIRHKLNRHEYALFVGRLEFRKNLGHIVAAVKAHPPLKLVCIGEPGFGYEESAIPALGMLEPERLIVLSRIPETELHTLYANALVSLQPSWDEGFGLPVLEAMAHGCPVITANLGATREVGQGAATLVDPEFPEQSVAAIEQLRSDRSYRQRMITAGLARARTFTWKHYGDSLVGFYRKLLSL